MTRRRDNPLLAWHASPFDLPEGRFGEMRQVSGRGQGAASYGRGAAYLAENPKVSGPGESEYMKEFARHPLVVKSGGVHTFFDMSIPEWYDMLHDRRTQQGRWNQRVALNNLHSHLINKADLQSFGDEVSVNNVAENLAAVLQAFGARKNSGDFIKFVDRFFDKVYDREDRDPTHTFEDIEAARSIAKDPKYFTPGSGMVAGPFSYKVAVHLGDDNQLDWDESLINHHDEVQNKVKTLIDPREDEYGYLVAHKGHEFYRHLTQQHGSDFAATEALHKAGIHGIRYMDGGSRGGRIKPDIYLDGQKVYEGGPGSHYALDKAEVAKHFADDDVQAVADFVTRAGYGANTMERLRKHYEDEIQSYNDVWVDRDDPSLGKLGPPGDDHYAVRSLKWLDKNEHRLRIEPRGPTYNYVVFHPDFIEALEQYDIQGRRVKAFAPKGVKLKSVDHDPFDGEGK